MDIDQQKLDEIYKLVKDNNRMLHAMRRNAFFGGIIKVLVWAAFVIIPAWLYFQYMAPQLQKLLDAANAVQGTGAQAQLQITHLQDALKGFQNSIPGLGTKQ